jgi:hypothetical protein
MEGEILVHFSTTSERFNATCQRGPVNQHHVLEQIAESSSKKHQTTTLPVYSSKAKSHQPLCL